MYGRADGNDELVDRCNALLGINEEPFPIKCDHLDLKLGLF
jgi:hypothetical protein